MSTRKFLMKAPWFILFYSLLFARLLQLLLAIKLINSFLSLLGPINSIIHWLTLSVARSLICTPIPSLTRSLLFFSETTSILLSISPNSLAPACTHISAWSLLVSEHCCPYSRVPRRCNRLCVWAKALDLHLAYICQSWGPLPLLATIKVTCLEERLTIQDNTGGGTSRRNPVEWWNLWLW